MLDLEGPVVPFATLETPNDDPTSSARFGNCGKAAYFFRFRSSAERLRLLTTLLPPACRNLRIRIRPLQASPDAGRWRTAGAAHPGGSKSRVP